MSKPTPEQLAAIASRDRGVFLEAGAGTGKTGVLVSRYRDAVVGDGVDPGRILAFTFTEKAAAEMRRRVRRGLAERADAVRNADPERAAELDRFARAGEGAWISTIHGFCRRLLAAHPGAAGLDPRFRVLDAVEADRLARRAYQEAIEELTSADEQVALLAAGFRGGALRELVVAAHEELRSRGADRPELPSAPAQTPAEGPQDGEGVPFAYEALRALLTAFGERYARLKQRRSGLDFEDLQIEALRLLREHPAVRDAYRARFSHILVDEFQDTNPVQVALIRELTGSETRLLTVGDEFQSIYGFRHADLEVFRSERQRALATPDTDVLALRGNFRSTPTVLAAVNALGDILLDDFEPLTAGTAVADGDGPDPAVELLLTEHAGWDEHAARLGGTAIAESGAARIAEARALARRLRELVDTEGVDRSDIVVLLRAFTHVGAVEEALRRFALDPYVVGGRGYWSHQQVEDALRLLACVANPLDDESLLGALACPAGGVSPDALWILRRIAGPRRHLWPVLERHFGNASDATEAAADRYSADSRTNGSSSDAAGDESWVERMPSADVERLAVFCSRLDELRSQAPLLSLDALVEQVIVAFGYDLTVLMMDGGPGRMANLRKLMGLAAEYEAHEGRDLRGFLDHVAVRAAATDREPEAGTQAERHAGVRVMTVHAAKGLEFDVVAVADLGRGLRAGGRTADIRLGFAPHAGGEPDDEAVRVGIRIARAGAGSTRLHDFDALTEAASAAEAAEGARLTYVAATRARKRLLLSGVFREADLSEREEYPHSASALARFLPAVGVTGEDGQAIEVPAPAPRRGLEATFAPGRILVSVSAASGDRARELAEGRSAAVPAPPGAGSGRPPLQPALDPGPAAARHLSYAALSDYRRCGYRFYVERVLRLGEGNAGAPGPTSRHERLGFGNAVHALLEWSARNRWSPPGGERARAALRQEGLPDDDERIGTALEMVGGWLSSELRAEIAGTVKRPRAEVPFLLPLDGTILRGTIDLLAEPTGAPPTLVDYKTNALAGAEPAEALAPYELQRGLYALAVASAAGVGAVRTAYVFLERPAEPVVRELDAAALDEARADLAALVAGVGAGRFEVTPEPGPALCHDCPARERLCPYDSRRTLGVR